MAIYRIRRGGKKVKVRREFNAAGDDEARDVVAEMVRDGIAVLELDRLAGPDRLHKVPLIRIVKS